MAGQIRRSLNINETKKEAQVAHMVEMTMAIAIISMTKAKNID